MRKIIVLVMLVVLSGCKLVRDNYFDYGYVQLYAEKELYYDDYSNIYDLNDIVYWIWDRIEYNSEDGSRSLKEIVNSGWGDCDDIALLFMNIAYLRFDIKCDLVLVYNREVVDGGDINHAVVRLPDGMLLGVGSNAIVEYESIGYIYYFDDIFSNK